MWQRPSRGCGSWLYQDVDHYCMNGKAFLMAGANGPEWKRANHLKTWKKSIHGRDKTHKVPELAEGLVL